MVPRKYNLIFLSSKTSENDKFVPVFVGHKVFSIFSINALGKNKSNIITKIAMAAIQLLLTFDSICKSISRFNPFLSLFLPNFGTIYDTNHVT